MLTNVEAVSLFLQNFVNKNALFVLAIVLIGLVWYVQIILLYRGRFYETFDELDQVGIVFFNATLLKF